MHRSRITIRATGFSEEKIPFFILIAAIVLKLLLQQLIDFPSSCCLEQAANNFQDGYSCAIQDTFYRTMGVIGLVKGNYTTTLFLRFLTVTKLALNVPDVLNGDANWAMFKLSSPE